MLNAELQQPSESGRLCLCSSNSARYYLAACIIAVWASLADFAMLSGQGWTVTDGCRQFFYAR